MSKFRNLQLPWFLIVCLWFKVNIGIYTGFWDGFWSKQKWCQLNYIRTLEHQVSWEKLMWSLFVSVTRYDISTYFDAWFCLRWPGLLSSGSLLAEDLNKWHFSSTTSTKENIIFTVLNCPWNYPFRNIPTSNFFWAVPVHQNSDWNYGFWKSGCCSCSCSCSYWKSPHSYFDFFHYSYFDFFHYSYFDFSCHIPTGSSSMDGHCLKYQI